MTLPRTVADVLAEHVVFEIECIDRMYLQRLRPAAAVRRRGRGLRAPPARAADRLDGAVGHDHRRVRRPRSTAFARRPGRALGGLRQGSTQGRRDARAPGRVRGGRSREGVLFIGRAQEKTTVFRTEKRRNAEGRVLSVDREVHRDGQPLLLLLPSTTTSARSSSSSAPTSPTTPSCASTATSGPSARPRKAGIGFTALDNAFAAVDDVAAVQAICDRPGPGPDRRPAAQVAGPAAAPVHRPRTGPRATATTSRSCRPSSP